MPAEAAPTPNGEQEQPQPPAAEPSTAATPSGPRLTLTRGQWILVALVIAGALAIAILGFVGSYHAVRDLALRKGFGWFADWFPISVDSGIGVCIALDLLLIWLRIPFPLLRPTAWLLTAGTVVFNAWAAYPDVLAMAMHATTPVLFILVVEAARHAIGRIADINAGRVVEYPPGRMWLVAPITTARIWRAQTRHGIPTYQQVIDRRRDIKVYRTRMRDQHGLRWKWKSAEHALPLRMARYGIPLSEAIALPAKEREERSQENHERHLADLRRQREREQEQADLDEELRQLNEDAEKERRRRAEEAEAERRRREDEEKDRREAAERARRIADAEEQVRLAKLEAEKRAAAAKAAAQEAEAQAEAEAASAAARAKAEAAQAVARAEILAAEAEARAQADAAKHAAEQQAREADAERIRQQKIKDAQNQAEIDRIRHEQAEANRRAAEETRRRAEEVRRAEQERTHRERPVATPVAQHPTATPTVRNAATPQQGLQHRNAATAVARNTATPNGATPVTATAATPNSTPRTVAAPKPATPADRDAATPDTSHLEQAIEEAARTVAADDSQLLTGAQVAKLKGVSPGTVRSWVNRGRLSPRQRDANGHNLYHPADVAELD